jgi:hypothetical protein
MPDYLTTIYTPTPIKTTVQPPPVNKTVLAPAKALPAWA